MNEAQSGKLINLASYEGALLIIDKTPYIEGLRKLYCERWSIYDDADRSQAISASNIGLQLGEERERSSDDAAVSVPGASEADDIFAHAAAECLALAGAGYEPDWVELPDRAERLEDDTEEEDEEEDGFIEEGQVCLDLAYRDLTVEKEGAITKQARLDLKEMCQGFLSYSSSFWRWGWNNVICSLERAGRYAKGSEEIREVSDCLDVVLTICAIDRLNWCYVYGAPAPSKELYDCIRSDSMRDVYWRLLNAIKEKDMQNGGGLGQWGYDGGFDALYDSIAEERKVPLYPSWDWRSRIKQTEPVQVDEAVSAEQLKEALVRAKSIIG